MSSRSSKSIRIAKRSMVNDPEVMYERRQRQLVLNRITQIMIDDQFHKNKDKENIVNENIENENNKKYVEKNRKDCNVCIVT